MPKSIHQTAARTFLQSPERIAAVLATSDLSGVPHGAVIYYHMDDDFSFYFLTATGTRKYQNLATNPNSSLVIGTGPEETTIQCQGISTLLEKGSEEESIAIIKIKKRLLDNDGTWPVFQLEQFEDESIAVFKFVPNEIHLLNLNENNQLPITHTDTESIL